MVFPVNNDKSYWQNVRSEILPLLDRRFSACLDVGGGDGETSKYLLNNGYAGSIQLWDANQNCIDSAIRSGEFSSVEKVDLDQLETWTLPGDVDLVLLLDVLEHCVEPWPILERLVATASPGTVFVISLPNVRDASVVLPLIFRGEWRYRENGVLDRTHLRFFTKKSMSRLITESGLVIESEIANRTGIRRTLTWLTLWSMQSILVKQYVFRCIKR